MAKLTTTDVANISGAESTAISTINTNNELIEAAIENTLSRDGTTPNTMGADLDMNNNDIINVNTIDGLELDTLAATVAVGTVTTGAEGTSATVVNSGTSNAAILDFTIPRGDTGLTGSDTQEISSLASLIADTDFTYTAGQTKTVVAGDYIRAKKEGFVYLVKALGTAASGYSISTAGGVLLEAQRLSDGSLHLDQWNVDKTGATSAVSAIEEAIAMGPGIIRHSPGQYLIDSTITLSSTDWGITFMGTAPAGLHTDYTQTAEYLLGHDGVMFEINGASKWQGITFQWIRADGLATGSRTAGTFCKLTGGVRQVHFIECYIEHFYDYGLHGVFCGGLLLRDTIIFGCGYNIRGEIIADSFVFGGMTGSGSGGGAPWVIDNIYFDGSSGNTHFINHRPNFSAGVGYRFAGSVTRISIIGGHIDHNDGGGVIIEGLATAIKISGADIFDNGTTTTNKPGILITSSQAAFGSGDEAGIVINGNNIFDREKGASGEKQDVGVELGTGGSVNRIVITSNGLSCTAPIKDPANIRLKDNVIIENNYGYTTQLSGISPSIATDATGTIVETIDVSDLTSNLNSSSRVYLTLTEPSNTDFEATLFSTGTTSGTTLDIRLRVITASATGGATVKVAWHVVNE